MENLRTVLGAPSRNRFPCPQPSSLERGDIPTLQRENYWCSTKLDGERRILIVEGDAVYDVNRSGTRSTLGGVRFPRYARRLTILDCELVGGAYHIIDCAICGGIDVHKNRYSERHGYAAKLVDEIIYMEGRSHLIHVKPIYPLQRLEEIYDPATSDGIIFTPENHPITYGTDPKLFKWKPLELHTVDFKLVYHNRVNLKRQWVKYLEPARDEGYDLFVRSDAANVPVAWTPLDQFAGYSEGDIVECKVDGAGRWVPLRKRADKPFPNSLYVYKRTLVCIRENIQLCELH